LRCCRYKKGELEGKNVSVLTPPPFNSRHAGYMRAYVTSGVAKVLGTTREVVGVHRERYVFPLLLGLSKVSGSGPDSTFMAVLKVGGCLGWALDRVQGLGTGALAPCLLHMAAFMCHGHRVACQMLVVRDYYWSHPDAPAVPLASLDAVAAHHLADPSLWRCVPTSCGCG
jgi:hypothetical protein